MGNIWVSIFFQPLLNILVGLYNIAWQDLGLAIIGLTIVIKLILWPLSHKSLRAQKQLQSIQPKINELREKYKNNKEEMSRELMKVYKEGKVSPLSSCLPVLVQLPFLIALYQVLRSSFDSINTNLLYPFITNPGVINVVWLGGLIDLSKPNWPLAVLTGVTQFWQTKQMAKLTGQDAVATGGASDMTKVMSKQMLYFAPALTVFFGFTLPGGLMLYWLALTLLTILQQSLSLRANDTTAPTI